MRKTINIFLAIAIVLMNFTFFINIVNAQEFNDDLSGNEVLNRIDNSKDVALDIIDKLTLWSNLHATELKEIIDNDLIYNMNNIDISIQTVIDELNLRGYSSAASDLDSIKQDLENGNDYLRTTVEMAEYYLANYINNDNVTEFDILYRFRCLYEDVKEPLRNLFNIYYVIFYNELYNIADTFDSYYELVDLYENIASNFVDSNLLYSKIKNRINRYKNIYISRNLDIYDYAFKEEFNDYYNLFKEDYRVLYDKLEEKLQTKLDNKINDIITDVDITNISEVIDANNALYGIIDIITDALEEVNSKFDDFNNLFNGVDMVLDYTYDYQKEIRDRLQEAIDYTKSKLILLGNLLEVKYEIDEEIIDIDSNNGILIYDSTNTTPSVLINKLLSNYGEINFSNGYNGKVGTKSFIQVFYQNILLEEYIVIVKGDINPNGDFDISDLVKLCDKIYEISDLDPYEFLAADFDDNGTIDITDLVNLCDKIYE